MQYGLIPLNDQDRERGTPAGYSPHADTRTAGRRTRIASESFRGTRNRTEPSQLSHGTRNPAEPVESVRNQRNRNPGTGRSAATEPGTRNSEPGTLL